VDSRAWLLKATADFGTTLAAMEPVLKIAGDTKGVKFEHRHWLQTAPTMQAYL
jgi:hypothetical protein